MGLIWVEAAKSEHRVPLQGFTCCSLLRRDFRRPDPEPWATEIQKWVRANAIAETNRWREGRDQRLRLAFEDDELVAIACHARDPELSTDEITTRRLLGYGVSTSRHGQRIPGLGLTYADATIDEVVKESCERTPAGRLALSAEVHPQNIRSQRVLQRWGLEPLLPGDANRYPLWLGIIRDG